MKRFALILKRLALYLVPALLVLLILLAAGVWWLIGTTAGARFLLGAVSGPALSVAARSIEGRLYDHLLLIGVKVTQPKLTSEVDRLELDWEPRRLLDRQLPVRLLALSGVRVQDDRPPSKKEPSLAWPRLSGFVRTFSAHVSALKIAPLSYRHLKDPPLVVRSVAATLDFKDGILTASGLDIAAPQGRVTGELAAGLGRPGLRVDLVLVPERPLQGMDLFSLQVRLAEGRSPEFLAGTIAAAGRKGGAQRLELTGELGITQKSFVLRGVNLARAGQRGSLTGQGSLTLTKAEPLVALTLRAKDLDLQQELKKPTRLSGTITFAGSRSGYHGRVALENRGPGWQSASLAADYRGTGAGIALSNIAGKLLEGTLGGDLEVAWVKGVRAKGNLSGRGLNPGILAADWSGRVNLDLAANVERSVKGILSGSVNGKLLESRLHGKELRGELVAAFAGERLRVDRLLLVGKGFDLRGAGQLDQNLDLTARVSDLSRLVPGTAGALVADARVRWRGGRLSGSASAQGRNVGYGGSRAGAVSLDAVLGEEAGYPVRLNASVQRLDVAGVRADTAQLALNGTAARHTLDLRLASTRARLNLALAGGYAGGVWRGELTGFSGSDAVGPWGMTAPAALEMSAASIRLAPLSLTGLPGERVELSADLSLKPYSGPVRVAWSGINLARANSWLSSAQLSGASSGMLDGRLLPGKRLVATARAEARGTLSAQGKNFTIERLSATLDADGNGLRAALDLALATNAGSAHMGFDSRSPATLSLPSEGNLALNVSGVDLALLRPFVPQNLTLDGRFAAAASGRLLPGARLDLKGDAALTGGTVLYKSETGEFDAAFQTARLSFSWRGGKKEAGRLQLSAEAAATGGLTARGERVALERFNVRADADRSGVRAALDLSLKGGGTVRGSLSSSAPASLALPETGEFALQWGGLDPSLLKPWMSGSIDLKGTLGGEVRGRLLPGKRLDVTGETEFAQGSASFQGTAGAVNASLRSATLAFAWRGETFTGKLDLALAEYGSAKGDLLLPIPARLPVAANPQGAVRGGFAGRVREHGFLTAVFPGLLQESHGDLDVDLKVAGVWQDPIVTGSLKLAKAGGYLPSAGIHVSDVQLTATLERDLIRIADFRAVSGGGHIEGGLVLQLKGWQVAGYQGSLTGERFQTVYLPELQMLTSPRFSFQGDSDRLALNGELLVPEMLISGPPARASVKPSKDVILEGVPPEERAAKKFPLLVQGTISLVLGDKIQVKAEGIDATLAGKMDLALNGVEHITSSGEIRVVKGRYRAYGIDLQIVRGRLYYVGGPVDKPNLDILALRTVMDVKAGVTVAGPLGSQVVKLYSEPAMPDVDTMAYIVLGHPLTSGSTDQASLVAGAASSLFSFGQGESLQDQIKDRLGLSVLGMETVDQSAAGRMGYKEIPVSPTGTASKATAGESLLTVGKYLTPKLYLSYGRSLVTGGNLFKLRYDIFKHWQVETQSGSESGADLYYKLEFD